MRRIRTVSNKSFQVLMFLLMLGRISYADSISYQLSDVPHELKNEFYGHNTVFVRGGLGVWDETENRIKPEVNKLVQDLSPGVLRFPGGTRAMLYRFWESIGPKLQRKSQCDPFSSEFDSTGYGPFEFFKWAQELGTQVSLVTPWAYSTPEEVASFVAYINGSTQDSRWVAGEDDVFDNNNRQWNRISDWAQKRAEDGQQQPFPLSYVEISNESFLDLKVKKKIENPCWCDEKFPINRCPQSFQANWQSNEVEGFQPTTVSRYVDDLVQSSRLIKRINPNIKVGAAAKMKIFYPVSSNKSVIDEVAAVDKKLGTEQAWNRTLYEEARDDFDFFAIHPYRILPYERLSLPQELEGTLKQFQKEFPDKKLAVTEFGFFKKGNTLSNAIVSAEMIKIATEYKMEMLLRHILIEDQSGSLFASHGAILGPDHKLTPSYHALKLMREHLFKEAFVESENKDWLKSLATRSIDKNEWALLIIKKAKGAETVEVAIPDTRKYKVVFHYLDYAAKNNNSDDIEDVFVKSEDLGTFQNVIKLNLGRYALGVLKLIAVDETHIAKN